jgi:hypothetical protein
VQNSSLVSTTEPVLSPLKIHRQFAPPPRGGSVDLHEIVHLRSTHVYEQEQELYRKFSDCSTVFTGTLHGRQRRGKHDVLATKFLMIYPWRSAADAQRNKMASLLDD